jgi:hypothetical protein
MKKRMTAGFVLGMTAVMAVSAYADGSITGKVENPTVVAAEDADGQPLENVELVIDTYEGEVPEDVAKLLDNDYKDYDVAIPLTEVYLVDADGNKITEAYNVTISVDITNKPDGKDLYVLSTNAKDGAAVEKAVEQTATGSLSASAVAAKIAKPSFTRFTLGKVAPTIEGTKVSMTFSTIEDAAFAILYQDTQGNTSNKTGDFAHVLPVAFALAAAAAAVTVARKKRA